MTNKQVQEKLCTESKETPAKALKFAIAYEDGLRRQNAYGQISEGITIKMKPVYSIRRNAKEC